MIAESCSFPEALRPLAHACHPTVRSTGFHFALQDGPSHWAAALCRAGRCWQHQCHSAPAHKRPCPICAMLAALASVLCLVCHHMWSLIRTAFWFLFLILRVVRGKCYLHNIFQLQRQLSALFLPLSRRFLNFFHSFLFLVVARRTARIVFSKSPFRIPDCSFGPLSFAHVYDNRHTCRKMRSI